MGIQRNFGKKGSRARTPGNRPRRARVLLVLGGVRTEVEYFTWVKKALATPGLDIEIQGQGWDPKRLFEHAIALTRRDKREARRDKDASNTYDAVWVVTDVDEFVEQLKEIKQRRGEGVKLAISNPCFEVWLTMHHDDAASPVDRFQAQRKAKDLGLVDPAHPKRLILPALQGRFETAAATARRLAETHARNGTEFPHDAPSTSVDLIVRYLLDKALASNPQLIVVL